MLLECVYLYWTCPTGFFLCLIGRCGSGGNGYHQKSSWHLALGKLGLLGNASTGIHEPPPEQIRLTLLVRSSHHQTWSLSGSVGHDWSWTIVPVYRFAWMGKTATIHQTEVNILCSLRDTIRIFKASHSLPWSSATSHRRFDERTSRDDFYYTLYALFFVRWPRGKYLFKL